jgi:hypothetical protein
MHKAMQFMMAQTAVALRLHRRRSFYYSHSVAVVVSRTVAHLPAPPHIPADPHGLALSPAAINRMVTLDYVEYASTFKPSSDVRYAGRLTGPNSTASNIPGCWHTCCHQDDHHHAGVVGWHGGGGGGGILFAV